MADRVWDGCVVPDDRLYDLDLHVWVRVEGDEVELGMTDVAQTMGGHEVHTGGKVDELISEAEVKLIPYRRIL